MATEHTSPETQKSLEEYFDEFYQISLEALERVLKLVRETDP